MAKNKNRKNVQTASRVKKNIGVVAENPVFELERKWIFLLLFGGIFLAYAQIWGNGLVWDDDPYITLNDAVKDFDIKALLSDFHVGNFHPLTMLSLALEYAVVGESPWLYHLNNLLLNKAPYGHSFFKRCNLVGSDVAQKCFN